MESILIELMNQKMVSNKKTSGGCDSFYRSEKSANNSDILKSSSKNHAKLAAGRISLKDPVPPITVATPQPKHALNSQKEETGRRNQYIKTGSAIISPKEQHEL